MTCGNPFGVGLDRYCCGPTTLYICEFCGLRTHSANQLSTCNECGVAGLVAERSIGRLVGRECEGGHGLSLLCTPSMSFSCYSCNSSFLQGGFSSLVAG